MGYPDKSPDAPAALMPFGRTASLSICLGICLIYLAFLPPMIINADGDSMFAVAESLAQHHTFAVPKETPLSIAGRGGRQYSILYPLVSLLAVPLVDLGSLLARLFHLPSHYVSSMFAITVNLILTAGSAYLTALIALSLGATLESAFLAALGYAFGTFALVYARTFFAEPLLTFLTAATVWCALESHHSKARWLVLLTALAVLAKPTGVILGPICASYLAARGGTLRKALPPIVGAFCGCLIYLAYNDLRFGGLFSFGHATSGTVQGFTLNVLPWSSLDLLLSPSRGLIWYAPIVLCLLLFRPTSHKPLDAMFILAIAIGYLLIYSPRFDWAAGWSWGPRFLLPALPGLVAIGVSARQQLRIVVSLVIIGFIVNAPNFVSYYERYYEETLLKPAVAATNSPWSFDCPLTGIWGSSYREIADARQTDVIQVVREAGGPQRGPEHWRALRVVAVWWWLLPAARIPRIIGALIAFGMILSGSWFIFRAWAVTSAHAFNCAIE
jgi:hypothetical protein